MNKYTEKLRNLLNLPYTTSFTHVGEVLWENGGSGNHFAVADDCNIDNYGVLFENCCQATYIGLLMAMSDADIEAYKETFRVL